MKLGVYTACLHDKPLREALEVIKGLGLTSAEINSGGFLPPVQIPMADLKSSQGARDEYLGIFAEAGIELTALNCNGNPLHPDPDLHQDQDLKDSIEVAGLLGVDRVVTMSGTPGTSADATSPSWTILPWYSTWLETRDYAWEVAIPFWKEIEAQARDFDVKIAIEMHPHNIVYNPPTMMRLVETIDATHVGAEMDPSHLMWQGIDIIAATRYLADVLNCAAAKDVRINHAARIKGVIDDSYGTMKPDDPDYYPMGGRYYLSRWPEDSAWDFVAVGVGHDVGFWSDFIRTIHEIDPQIPINIEHEDKSMSTMDGLTFAANTLLAGAELAGLG